MDRRTLLAGLAAGATGLFPFRSAFAAVDTTPPGNGPLSAKAVGDLLRKYKVPGASLAVLDKGALAAAYSYGIAQPGKPVTADTRFQAASISKTANALTILRMVANGRLGLDDKVNAHLTSWNLPDNALTKATPVTVRMLLSHTGGTTVSGFAGYAPGTRLPTLRQILDGKPPANSAPVRVKWPPGQGFHYSGGGTTVLQQMVMDITGEPYPATVSRLVLRPLAMNDSTFGAPINPPARAQVALAYGPNGNPNPRGFMLHPELAAAGLWTTSADIARMVNAMINAFNGGPNALIPRNLARVMLTPVASNCGLGVFIDARGVFNHLGSNIGYRSLYVGNPKTNSGLAVMTNGDNGEGFCADMRKRVAQVYGWT